MDEATTIVATVIPIFSLLVALVIVVVAMILKSRTDARRHKERMLLAEKGMDIPPQLYDALQRQEVKSNGYKTGRAWLMILGSMLVFVGLGVMIFQGIQGGKAEEGVVPLFIGLGFLVAERMIAKFIAKPDKS